MVWVAVWAIGVVAFLYYFGRAFIGRGGLFILLFFAGLIALVALALAGGFAVDALVEAGYEPSLQRISRLGQLIAESSAAILVCDLVLLVVILIRRGQPDATEGEIVTDNRVITVPIDGQAYSGWSKYKVLVSRRSSWIRPKTLLDSTAPLAERMLVVCGACLFTSFWLIFVGVGLAGIRMNLLSAAFMIVPSLWYFPIARAVCRDVISPSTPPHPHSPGHGAPQDPSRST